MSSTWKRTRGTPALSQDGAPPCSCCCSCPGCSSLPRSAASMTAATRLVQAAYAAAPSCLPRLAGRSPAATCHPIAAEKQGLLGAENMLSPAISCEGSDWTPPCDHCHCTSIAVRAKPCQRWNRCTRGSICPHAERCAPAGVKGDHRLAGCAGCCSRVPHASRRARRSSRSSASRSRSSLMCTASDGLVPLPDVR